MRWIAIAMGLIAGLVWLGVFVRSRDTKASAPTHELHDLGIVIDAAPAVVVDAALDGTWVEVDRHGAKLLVPAGWKHERLENDSITVSRGAVVFVVATSRGARLAKLASPIDGIVDLGKSEKLRVTSIITDGPNKTLGKLEGFRAGIAREQVLYIVTAPTYRCVVYLQASGVHDPAVDQLVDEIVHGRRLLLP